MATRRCRTKEATVSDEGIRVYVVEFGDRQTYQLQWLDPITQRKRTKSTPIRRTGLSRDRKAAERLAGELQLQLERGAASLPSRLTWEEFRRRYEVEVVPGLAVRTGEKIRGVFNRLEREIGPRRLLDLDEKRLSAFASRLRAGDEAEDIRGLAESTIAGHLGHLKAALGWARSQKLIPAVPMFPKTRRAKVSRGAKVMRGRPITTEEFERMLAEVPHEVGQANAPAWIFYLRGLWTSGLRLTESLEFHWDRPDKLHPDFGGRYPMLRIPAELEKGHKDRLLPMAPEFAQHLETVPAAARTGPVFQLPRPDGRAGYLRADRVSKIVSAIGKRANVRVGTTKTASAHDLRRAFGERWAARLMPAQLMELMRHESIETTLSFYVGRNAERTAAILWDHVPRSTGESRESTSDDTTSGSSRRHRA